MQYTPLYNAITHYRLNATKTLLNNGANATSELLNHIIDRWDINSDGNSDSDDDSDTTNPYISLLIRHGAEWDILLSVNYYYKTYRCIYDLVQKGASTTIRDKNGRTPMHRMMRYDSIGSRYDSRNETRYNIIKLFVEHGANIDAKDNKDRTPMHEAAHSNFDHTVEALIDMGADINAIDCNGRSPLHYAAYSNSQETVDVLLKYGADIRIRDCNNSTAAHTAAVWCRGYIACRLIDHLLDN